MKNFKIFLIPCLLFFILVSCETISNWSESFSKGISSDDEVEIVDDSDQELLSDLENVEKSEDVISPQETKSDEIKTQIPEESLPVTPPKQYDSSLVTAKPKEIAKGRSTTLGKIIDESPFKGKKINLISIDIENHEYEVLKDFDFGKYKIDVIVTEWTDLTQNKLEIYNQSIEKIQKSKIYNLFIKNNYKLINWVNSDLVFARRDFNI